MISLGELRVEAVRENLRTISYFLHGIARRLELTEETLFEIEVAVEEAAVNIVNHAYPSGLTGENLTATGVYSKLNLFNTDKSVRGSFKIIFFLIFHNFLTQGLSLTVFIFLPYSLTSLLKKIRYFVFFYRICRKNPVHVLEIFYRHRE